jgi:hypothetical protein
VHHNCTTKTEKSKLDTTNLQQHRTSLVNDVKFVDLILARAELLKYPYIFTRTPYRVHRYVELKGAVQERRKFRQGQITSREARLDWSSLAWLLYCLLYRLRYQWRVLRNMFEGPG